MPILHGLPPKFSYPVQSIFSPTFNPDDPITGYHDFTLGPEHPIDVLFTIHAPFYEDPNQSRSLPRLAFLPLMDSKTQGLRAGHNLSIHHKQ